VLFISDHNLRPFVNTWTIPATKDCQRITPEPLDGSSPQYTQDDDMLQGRTMGQFIILPTGKMVVVNGGANGMLLTCLFFG
jgi:hypothetical protein